MREGEENEQGNKKSARYVLQHKGCRASVRGRIRKSPNLSRVPKVFFTPFTFLKKKSSLKRSLYFYRVGFLFVLSAFNTVDKWKLHNKNKLFDFCSPMFYFCSMHNLLLLVKAKR